MFELLAPPPQVCIDIPSNDEDGNDAFGGLERVAEAFQTDLVNGITGEIGDLSQRRANAVYETPVPAARNFFELVMKSSNRHTIFLLIVSAALSLGFGIKEEGPRTGWYEGVLIILAIIILVIVPAVRDFLGENSENLRSCDWRRSILGKGMPYSW